MDAKVLAAAFLTSENCRAAPPQSIVLAQRPFGSTLAP